MPRNLIWLKRKDTVEISSDSGNSGGGGGHIEAGHYRELGCPLLMENDQSRILQLSFIERLSSSQRVL